MENYMIELKHLSKSYNGRKVLDDISFVFPDQGFYLITGENGCGKTTLFNILDLFISDYQGSYLLFGKEGKSYTTKEIDSLHANDISFLFQKTNYISFLKPNQNRNYPDIKEEKTKQKNISQMSLGEKELVSLQRGLKSGKKIYLVDEITRNLDVPHSEEVIKTLKELSKTALVLFITHDERAISEADNILRLGDGHLEVVKESSRIVTTSGIKTVLSLKKRTEKKHYFELVKRNYLHSIGSHIISFILLFFCFSMIWFPLVAVNVNYTGQLGNNINEIRNSYKKDYLVEAPQEDYLRFDIEDEVVKQHYGSSVLPSLNQLAISDQVSDDYKIHIPSSAIDDIWPMFNKVKRSVDIGVFKVAGQEVKLDYVLDDTLTSNFPTVSKEYFSHMISDTSSFPNGLTIYNSLWICPALNKERLTTRWMGYSKYISQSLYEKKSSNELPFKISDDEVYVNYQYSSGLLTSDKTSFAPVDESTKIYFEGDKIRYFGNPLIDMNAVFSNGIYAKTLPTDVAPSEAYIISDTNYQKLRSAMLVPDSYILKIDRNNLSEEMNFLTKEQVFPSYTDCRGKTCTFSYSRKQETMEKSKVSCLILSTIGSVLICFIIIINCYSAFESNKENRRLLYSLGENQFKLFTLLISPTLINTLLGSFLGYFASMLVFSASADNVLGFFPLLDLKSFLTVLMVFLLAYGVSFLIFKIQKEK